MKKLILKAPKKHSHPKSFRTKNEHELRRSLWNGTQEMWRKAREIILEAVDRDGTFLDIGCANGVLARDLCIWAREKKGIKLIPYGIDIIEELIEECKEKNPGFKANFVVAHRMKFNPQRKFTFICAALPEGRDRNRNDKFLKKYLDILEPKGRLILTLYDDRKDKFILADNYCRKKEKELGFFFAGSAEVYGITHVIWLEKLINKNSAFG